MATFKLRANPLTGQTLTVFLAPQGGAVANGSGDAMTESSGLFSATIAESLTGLHDYWVKDTDGDTVWVGTVYCSAASIWIADAIPSQYPPVERPTDDTAVIEFYWPIASATFANSASTCKRRFLGETGAQEEALSGAISAISGKAGWYKIAYALADRAADATTVIPTSVTYTLVDDAGNVGELTLKIVEFTSTGGANGIVPAIVLSFDPLTKAIGLVRNDAYLTSLGTDIQIPVNIPSGVNGATISGARLGAKHRHKSTTLVGDVTLEEIDSQWTAIIEFPMSATLGKDLGEYAYDVEITYNSQDITILSGSLRLIQDYSTHA